MENKTAINTGHNLVSIIQELSLARDIGVIMDIVKTSARKITGADGATFILRDNDLCHYADEDSISPLWKGKRFPMMECVSGWVMQNRQSAIIEDIYADSRVPTEVYRSTFVKSLAMVPIRSNDPIGAVGIYWSQKYLASAEELALLQSLADSTAVAIQNLNTIDLLNKTIKELLAQKEEIEIKRIELIEAKELAEKNEAIVIAALENSQAGIAIAELPSGKLKYVNEAALLISGKEYDEIVKDIEIDKYVASWQILHLDGTPYKTDEVPLAKAVLYGEKSTSEFIVRRDNNDDRVVWANAAPIFDSNGVQTSAIVIFLDITEQKQIERELSRSEIEFHSLAESMPQIVWITRPDGWNIYFNQQWVDYTGLTLEESYGHGWNKPFHPDDQKRAWNAWQNATTNLATYSLECRLRRYDGEYKWWLIRGVPLMAENNTVSKWFGTCTDIDKIKREEEEMIILKARAEESDSLKSAFLANMSHEIRTPMNGILGFAELLKEPNLTGDEQKKYISIIEKSGDRMLNLINEIIEISKIESGLMKLDIKESNVNEQMDFIYNFFKLEADSKKIELIVIKSLPTKNAIVLTDREKLYAILSNLVKNAIKYTNTGSIEFGYELAERDQESSLLQFYVKDTGIGIPFDRQAAIFERFVQADIEDKKAMQGAGLGLSIARSYVEMLGGKIWVESEEGIGSIFYFTLPYQSQAKEEKPVNNVVSNQTIDNQLNVSVSGLKILIAEDDETSEIFLTKVANVFGKEIFHANNGLEAIALCRNNPDIDLILMDIQMPAMGGYEATRHIRQFNKEVVIIAQTAYALSGDREKAIEAGCNAHISKPISKVQLMDLINRHFKKPSQKQV